MRMNEYLPEHEQLDEISWKDLKKGAGQAALAGAIATSPGTVPYMQHNFDDIVGGAQDTVQTVSKKAGEYKDIVAKKVAEIPPEPEKSESEEYKPITDTKNEKFLAKVAHINGIRGEELAAFMAQAAHESQGFTNMIEDHPDVDRYLRNKQLGNRNRNDAERFIGRGFIQLTGHWNYKWMEKELGIDLTSTWSNAQKAAEPEIAAKIAVIYWKKRVRPKVDDFSNVKSVTKPINSGMKNIDDRQEKFNDISRGMNL
jgi:predicted chitinase